MKKKAVDSKLHIDKHYGKSRKELRKYREKRSVKERILSWAYLAPSLLGVLVFFILPFCVVVYYSTVDNPITHQFVGLENFTKILDNKAFQIAAKNTGMFSLIAVPLAVVLSLLLALMLDCKIPFKSQLRSFFLSPLMVPIASIVLIWQVLFHNNGVVNAMLANLGAQGVDWLKSEKAQSVIVLLFQWKNLGYNMILFMSALANIPQDIIEVARLESANAFQIFFKIKLRYLSPTILFVTIMSLINSFKVFREIYLLTGKYPFSSIYMLQHFMNNTFLSLDYQKLSAAAILMSLVMVVIIGILFITENHFGKDVEE